VIFLLAIIAILLWLVCLRLGRLSHVVQKLIHYEAQEVKRRDISHLGIGGGLAYDLSAADADERLKDLYGWLRELTGKKDGRLQ
jgi:hypothetical protein